MSMFVNCPNCHTQLGISEDVYGKSAQCSSCSFEFDIAEPAKPAAPKEPEFNYPPDYVPSPTYDYHLQGRPELKKPSPLAYQGNYAKRFRKKKSTVPWVPLLIGAAMMLVIVVLVALVLPQLFPTAAGENLLVARDGFTTTIVNKQSGSDPPPTPPSALFDIVKYDSEVGPLSAYVGKDPGDGKKHAAIIWLTGGFSNGIGAVAWKPQGITNDQSAAVYRESGMIMMYPSLRGGNDNPGNRECFYGEVNDVLDAADYLASLPYVDSNRIYLGGHSTGGTLVLLCAAASENRFRGVISVGPVEDVGGYGSILTFDTSNSREFELRNPLNWIGSIRVPTYVVEGNGGNAVSAERLKTVAENNPNVDVFVVSGHGHFSILAPLNRLLANKIKSGQFQLTAEELKEAR